jgi:DNA-binding GntR family transcriptional regulator
LIRNIINRKSLTEQVCDYLRKCMEDGILKPGDPVDEKSLCEKLNVSRTPIREALHLLHGEGLITILPRRRIYVNELKLEDIEKIYQVVGPLEGEAALAAIEKMSEEDIQQLENLTKDMRQSLERGDFDKYEHTNMKIHDLFLEKNDNEILNRIVRLLKKRYYTFPQIMTKKKILKKEIPQWDLVSMEYHEKMVELCKKRDKKGIRKLIRDYHWSFKKNRPFLLESYKNEEN